MKTAARLLMLYPALWLAYHAATGGFGPLPIVGLIYWSGVWATILLLLTLSVTPISRVFRWRRLVTVRRTLGVSALAYTLAHVVIYAALYRWNLGVVLHDLVTRLTLIVATASTLGLIALGATSFDGAVRSLGGRTWKRLHRTNYVLTGLAVLHYLLSPGIFSMQYVCAGIYLWLMAWRWLDARGLGRTPRALAGLAVAAFVGTAAFESLWIWIYHGYSPRETFADLVGFIGDPPAAWTVLALGLLVALAAKLWAQGGPTPEEHGRTT